MSTFISALRNGAKLLERRDDDGFDRLSNRYSVGTYECRMAAWSLVLSYRLGYGLNSRNDHLFTGLGVKLTGH